MYRVLRPIYEKTGESMTTPDGLIYWNRVRWEDMGQAESMADALEKFPRSYWTTYSPVLEWIGKPH